MDDTQILRFGEIERLLRLSKATVYRLIARGEFPRPIKLGPRAVGWRRCEVAEWLDARERTQLPAEKP